MTEGTFVRSNSASPQYYNGRWTIDGQSLYMSNRATAALYYYTPHTYPGFFGNYNFVNLYTQWFGSIYQLNPFVSMSQGISFWSQPEVSQPLTVRVSFTNSSSDPADIGHFKVIVRDPDGNNADFPGEDITIPANGTYDYIQTKTFSKIGKYRAWTSTRVTGLGWQKYYPNSADGSVVRDKTFTVHGDPAKPAISDGISSRTILQTSEIP